MCACEFTLLLSKMILKKLSPSEVAAAREKAGMTQQQAADLLHITIRPYQRFETVSKGRSDMSNQTRFLFWLAVENNQKYREFLFTLRRDSV
jgi:DNA-binding transcriptional regulator YiaG